MTVDIHHRLSTADTEFLSSFNEESSLESFRKSWSTLVGSLNAQTLDPDTSRLAHTAAHRIGTLASGLLEIHEHSLALRTNLVHDLDILLGQLTINDVDAPTEPTTSPLPIRSSCNPPYIAPAYKWLLKNIHNPYPSKETKNLISQATDTSVQNVDAWFLNIRRRIGWTALSRRYFSGSKAETIAAARRVLIEVDHVGLDGEPLAANIRMAFVQMEASAKELYSDKFTKSALAGKLDGMVKDMTDEDRRKRETTKATKKEQTKRQREVKRAAKKKQTTDIKLKEAEASLLSPTSTPSVTDTDGEEPTPLQAITRRKRSSPENASEDGNGDKALSGRPLKQSRVLSSASVCSSTSSSSTTISHFSAPSSRATSCTLSLSEAEGSRTPSIHDPNTLACSESLLISSPAVELVQSATRKRRRSEAGTDPAPKRQMLVRPRLQTVSAPLPTSTYSDSLSSTPSSTTSSIAPSPLFEVTSIPNSEWSSLFFDTPGTAVLDELDLSMLHRPEFSCIAETAALLNCGVGLDEFMGKGSDPLPTQSHLLNPPSDDQLDPLFGLNHPDPSISWAYGGAISQLLSAQLPLTTSAPCKLGTHMNHAHTSSLTSLDDFSLSSLPTNQMADHSASSVSSEATSPLSGIDWFSIIPQPLLSDGFDSHTTSIDNIDESSQVHAATGIVNMPALPADDDAMLPVLTAPLAIKPESRAEKYRQYRELLNKAKQLEAELGHS